MYYICIMNKERIHFRNKLTKLHIERVITTKNYILLKEMSHSIDEDFEVAKILLKSIIIND